MKLLAIRWVERRHRELDDWWDFMQIKTTHVGIIFSTKFKVGKAIYLEMLRASFLKDRMNHGVSRGRLTGSSVLYREVNYWSNVLLRTSKHSFRRDVILLSRRLLLFSEERWVGELVQVIWYLQSTLISRADPWFCVKFTRYLLGTYWALVGPGVLFC